jgi:hypothetical protein
MRVQSSLPAILISSLLGSSHMATAQTGEFATQVPGPIVHNGWELQDQLQNARSGTAVKSVNRSSRSYDGWNSAKPAAADGITTNATKVSGNRRTP